MSLGFILAAALSLACVVLLCVGFLARLRSARKALPDTWPLSRLILPTETERQAAEKTAAEVYAKKPQAGPPDRKHPNGRPRGGVAGTPPEGGNQAP